MIRKLAVLGYHLAVAVIAIAMFTTTLVLFATHQINAFQAILISTGTALAGTIAVLRFRHEKEPWPIMLLGRAR